MSSENETCCIGIILLVIVGVIIYLIYTFPIQSLALVLIIGGIIVFYYLLKAGMIHKMSSFFSSIVKTTYVETQHIPKKTTSFLQKRRERILNAGKKRDLDVMFYEFVIWFSMPYVIMYLFANNFDLLNMPAYVPGMLGLLGFILTMIGIISRPLMIIRRRREDIKDTRVYFLIEWVIWAIGIPLIILGLFTSLRISLGWSLDEIWNDYFIYRFIIATVFFMGYIVAPIVAYVGVFTRPFLKKKIEEKKMENEKKEIIRMIKDFTRG